MIKHILLVLGQQPTANQSDVCYCQLDTAWILYSFD